MHSLDVGNQNVRNNSDIQGKLTVNGDAQFNGNVVFTASTTVHEITFMESDIASSTPNRNTLYANNIVKGWANWDQLNFGNKNSFNVSSLTDVAAGRSTVVWDRDFKTDYYAVAGTSHDGANACDVHLDLAVASPMLSTQVSTQTSRPDGLVTDCTRVNIMAIGNQ